VLRRFLRTVPGHVLQCLDRFPFRRLRGGFVGILVKFVVVLVLSDELCSFSSGLSDFSGAA
jgi:hypothetical protein